MSRPCGLLVIPFSLIGCIGEPTPRVSTDNQPAPIGVQIMHAAPDLKGQRFTNLLHFESASDSVFVSSSNLRISRDSAQAHTGKTSLRCDGFTGSIRVKLGSVLGNRSFPGEWTLGGAYFYAEKPADLTVTCELGGQPFAQNRVRLSPGEWAAALVDLANVHRPAGTAAPSLTFSISSAGRIWMDDVLLIDNTEWIAGNHNAQAGIEWSLVRRGFEYAYTVPGSFNTRLTTREASRSGWRIEEANGFRARFSSTGEFKTLTIYPDGRSYWDGQFRPLSASVRSETQYTTQESSPAQIEIAETMGRVERRSPGDSDNDGYNESRGSYMLVANGPRLEARIIPQSTPVLRPILEVTGLPAGKPLVTIEGRLLEHLTRLEDGTLLIEIPSQINRPTSINVRIQ